jgi:predicted HTH transcriptional regulator
MITLEELTGGESKNIKFKEMLPDKSQNYLKTVVSFANTIGGKLIIGVEDKTHKVVGVNDDTLFQTMDSITNACLDAGLKAPEFIDMEISVRVNIYRKNAVENTPQVTENTHQVATSAPVTGVSDPEKTAQKNRRRWTENRRRWTENRGRWTKNRGRWTENRRGWTENRGRWTENCYIQDCYKYY